MRACAMILLLSALAVLAAPGGKPTFYKDVLPILQNRCQECHRAGEIAPMAFGTYKEVRPWAKSIRESVRTRRMPPWFADPHHGAFSNDRSLSPVEIETLTTWAENGALEGKSNDQPPPKQWTGGWSIPQKPDLVVQMPAAFQVPAQGTIDYQYVVVPTGLTDDRWVRMVEARPSDRSVVHHAVIFVREPGNSWLRNEAKPGVPFVPPRTTADGKPRGDIDGYGSEFLTVYTPDVFKPGQARLIKAGSDLVFQLHYTANGKASEDRTSVGLVFADEPPAERIITISAANTKFVIPPGEGNYRVPARFSIPNGGTLLSFFPHMHVRGKGFEWKLTQPGEPEQMLLKVNNYNFNWQLTYRLQQPIQLKPGAQMEIAGFFDNSPNNPHNPDAKAEVRWGEQSWEEMMVGFFDVAVPVDMDRRSFFRPRHSQQSKTD